MKKTLIQFLLLFLVVKVSAQSVSEFMLNRYFEVTTIEKDFFFLRLAKPYKGYWAITDYDSKKRIVQTGFFTDSTFKTPVGPFKFYWENVKMFEGNYVKGKPSGYWYFFDKKGKLSDSLHYYVVADSAKTTLSDSATFLVEKQKTQTLQNEHLKKDTSKSFNLVEVEAEFPGGSEAWKKHIIKNIDFPDLVMNLKRPQKGTVMIQFIVCSDGEVCSVEALNSFHPLMDLIAVNAIRKGPHWKPAMQNGRMVKAWRRQPITFVVSD